MMTGFGGGGLQWMYNMVFKKYLNESSMNVCFPWAKWQSYPHGSTEKTQPCSQLARPLGNPRLICHLLCRNEKKEH